MKVTLKRLNDDYHMEATNATGNTIQMDGSPGIGGQNLGARPMEVVLMSLAGCSSIDVISILKKMKQEVTDYDVEVTAERRDEIPSIFTKIHMKFLVKGIDLDGEKVRRAAQLSAEKYCSVSKILEPTAEITWDVVVG
ncbi:MAG: OsmC family protein [Flavobacteriales bacterium]|jgi:putative redox protein|nr:OsmC family protein [Flavobacteriales bacterium]